MWWLQIFNGVAWVTVADAFSPKVGEKKWAKWYAHKFPGRVYNSITGKTLNMVEAANA